MSNVLRYLARCGAYAITMLLAAVWTVGGSSRSPARCTTSASR